MTTYGDVLWAAADWISDETLRPPPLATWLAKNGQTKHALRTKNFNMGEVFEWTFSDFEMFFPHFGVPLNLNFVPIWSVFVLAIFLKEDVPFCKSKW